MSAIARFLSRPFSLLPMLVLLAPASAGAMSAPAPQESDAQAGPANYELAARFAPYRIQEMVHSTSVDPRWIEGSDKFWYEWENSDGKFFHIVDPGAGARTLLFDNDRIAAELTRITRDPWDGQHLPIRNIRFISDDVLHFEVESSQDEEDEEVEEDQDEEEDDSGSSTRKRVHHFEYTVSTRTLRELEDYEAPDNHPDWASVSPDGQTVVFARDHNLYMMSGADYERILEARRGKSGDEADDAEDDVEVAETQLTTDGEKYHTYEANYTGRGATNVTLEEEMDDRKAASVSWAKDSRRFALVRRDNREVGELWVVHVVGKGNARPELETYSYEMAGEESVTQEEIVVYDLASRSQVTVAHEPWKDEDLRITTQRQFDYPDSEEPDRSLWISDDSEELHFVRLSRDRHRAAVMVADAASGDARMLFVDSLNTYIETRPVEMLSNGDMLWWSERDGWAHLYLYGPDGEMKQRLTEGAWHVDGIVGVDEARGFVFFTGQGREEGEDPYYAHLYRVGLNGAGLTLLNPGDYNHQFEMGESNRFFVNNYSRVDTAPMSALFDASGRRILDLGEADFGALEAAGYQYPSRTRSRRRTA